MKGDTQKPPTQMSLMIEGQSSEEMLQQLTDTQKTLQSSQVSEADRFISDMQDNDRNSLN